MAFPDFFARVPTVVLRDPLAELLGAADGGLIEYGYADAVRLAGHSCPTVAGAYLMAVRMLRRLYGDAVPERGSVKVELRAPQDEGVAGVIAAVFGLLTGAAGEGGFKGLAGRYGRRNLLVFGVDGLAGDIRLTRLDNGVGVTASLDLSPVPAPAGLGTAMQEALSVAADAEAGKRFAQLWQQRVCCLLLDYFEHPELVHFAG
jgi:hypothetical protein